MARLYGETDVFPIWTDVIEQIDFVRNKTILDQVTGEMEFPKSFIHVIKWGSYELLSPYSVNCVACVTVWWNLRSFAYCVGLLLISFHRRFFLTTFTAPSGRTRENWGPFQSSGRHAPRAVLVLIEGVIIRMSSPTPFMEIFHNFQLFIATWIHLRRQWRQYRTFIQVK